MLPGAPFATFRLAVAISCWMTVLGAICGELSSRTNLRMNRIGEPSSGYFDHGRELLSTVKWGGPLYSKKI